MDSTNELTQQKLRAILSDINKKLVENIEMYQSYPIQYGLRVKKDPVIKKQIELQEKESEFLEIIKNKLYNALFLL